MTATAPIRSEGPPWAKGYDVAWLKEVCARFKAHDGEMVRGAFGRYSELSAADDLSKGNLYISDFSAIVARKLTRTAVFSDFAGRSVHIPKGVLYVPRMAWEGGELGEMLNELGGLAAILGANGLAVQAWTEHSEEQALVELFDLNRVAVAIKASSEMRGLYTTPGLVEPLPLPTEQLVALGFIGKVPPRALSAAASAVPRVGDFAAHYSGYSVKESWSALSLRGFYADPNRIEKPAEMNKKWKAEHADELDNHVRDTRLRRKLPEMEKLINLIPGEHQRIRLMGLSPGGGELARHADIIDREAGAAEGQIARFHLPLISNDQVEFTSWRIDGGEEKAVMQPGDIWYLDTRKPHRAINAGGTPRIHLVIDTRLDARGVKLLATSERPFPSGGGDDPS